MASSATASSPPPVSSPTGKKSTTASARNPVALRLYKVLSTNFDDAATREALQTLSDLYAPSSTKEAEHFQPVEELKDEEEESDNDSDDLDIEDVALRGDIPAPTTASVVEMVPGEIAARARRHLRRDMEKKLAEGSRQFLKTLAEVDQVCGSC